MTRTATEGEVAVLEWDRFAPDCSGVSGGSALVDSTELPSVGPQGGGERGGGGGGGGGGCGWGGGGGCGWVCV